MNEFLIFITLFIGIILSFNKNNFRVGLEAILFFSLSYLIYAGFRDINFGEDSINYYNNYFLNANQYISVSEFISSGDIFFKFINYLLLFFSDDWYFYSFSMAFICLYLVIKIDILSNSERNAFFFTALIITNPIFIENTTNILRSTLCCLILMLGYLSYQKNKKKGVIIILLGCLTHYIQSFILFSIFFLVSRFKLIENNKQKNIFTALVFIVIFLKTFTTVMYSEFLNDYFMIINEFFSEAEVTSYTIKQIISDNVNITINIFFQLLLYIIVPLYFIKFDNLKSNQKKLLNFIALSISIYIILFPQLPLVLRLIPFCILGVTYIFAIQMNNYKSFYSILILFFNSLLIYYNLTNA